MSSADTWTEQISPGGAPRTTVSVPKHVAAAAAAGTTARTWDADQAVTELYSANYRSLVRLSVLLVRDIATAEETVQDSFVALHSAWRRLRDPDKALLYLRQTVVNRSRSVLRHRVVVEKHVSRWLPNAPSAEHAMIVEQERSEVIEALTALPTRQREALVLRYYADLSEEEIASAMGISRGTVKSHTARGMAALRTILDRP